MIIQVISHDEPLLRVSAIAMVWEAMEFFDHGGKRFLRITLQDGARGAILDDGIRPILSAVLLLYRAMSLSH